MDKKISTRLAALLLALLTLSGCSRQRTAPPDNVTPDISETVAAPTAPQTAAESAPEVRPPDNGNYEEVLITADNWRQYFEIVELPMTVKNSFEEIDEIKQYYCVVLRDEYAARMRYHVGWSVTFTFTFPIDIETLDFKPDSFRYFHTDDHIFATEATRDAVFDCNALGKDAWGQELDIYLLTHSADYQNAFFQGTASYAYDVWQGFYIDIDQVRLESVSGSLQLNPW